MPANDADYQRNYMARYRASGKDGTRAGGVSVTRRFVGCDGEGATLDNGYHAYFMLTIGRKVLRPKRNEVRLTTIACLDFIASQDPNNIYVGYFFDYDVTKILEDLPFDKMQRLVDRKKRTGINGQIFPVDYMGYQIEYLPRKEFKVRRALEVRETETIWSPWVTINDVGSFFQCPFLKAIKDWKIGTEEEWALIEDGKLMRGSFDIEDYDEIARYNALEIRLLQLLMEAFRQACIKTGYVPKRWQGPGLLAEAILRGNGVRKSAEIPLLNSPEYRGLLEFGVAAFYGGRSEVAAVGPVNQLVYQYDINSAYPYAMQVVPCLLHGGFEYLSGDAAQRAYERTERPTGRKGESFGIAYGCFSFAGGKRPYWYGLPLRTENGTIVFPETGNGWYWTFEIKAAIHQSFSVEGIWLYTRNCVCKPLGFVPSIYAKRQAIGKDGPGIVLKLGMNSLYGKTVQSIGKPKYSNPIWGSFITAYPRMMIQEFIHDGPNCANGCGSDVFMVATDSVATTRDMGWPDSKELGGWSREIHKDGLFIVQPGVYFGSSGKPAKTRGVPRAFMEAYENTFRERFDIMVSQGDIAVGSVRVPQKLFCGLRYAVHRHNVKLAGQWIEFNEDSEKGKLVSFDWNTKRAPFPALAPNGERSWIQTFPYEGHPEIVTTPYSKNIGGLLERESLRMPFEDQPDWAYFANLED